MEARLDHVVFEVRDPTASVSFYRDVLGLAPVRLEEFRRGDAPFPSVRVSADCIVDLFPPPLWQGDAPVNPNHTCLTVSRAELAALEERLGGAGVAVERRRDHNFGARGYGKAIYFRDPDGIVIEVRHYETGTA